MNEEDEKRFGNDDSSSSFPSQRVAKRERSRSRKSPEHERKRDRDRDRDRNRNNGKKRSREAKGLKKRPRKECHTNTHSDESSDYSISSSSSSDNHRKQHSHKKRKRSHKRSHSSKKKKKKKSSNKHHKERRRTTTTNQEEEDSLQNNSGLERNFAFGEALLSLLTHHPELSSDFPIMLLRMTSGTSFDLTQMSNPSISQKLQIVMQSLSSFGVCCQNGSWTWKGGASTSNNNNNKASMVLIKVTRFLLDEIGITMEAVEQVEQLQQKELKSTAVAAKAEKEKMYNEAKSNSLMDHLHLQVISLLERFEQAPCDNNSNGEGESASPSLAKELASIFRMVLNGECIALNGLPNVELRDALEDIFKQAGLEQAEIEADSDDGDDSHDEGSESQSIPTVGFGLPSGNNSLARTHMTAVLNACQDGKYDGTKPSRSNAAVTQRKVRGPLLKPPSTMNSASVPIAKDISDDDDDDDGPAPLGATEYAQRGPTLPSNLVKALADKRKHELDGVALGSKGAEGGANDGNTREQWMMEPGEHEFLKTIQSGNLKNRKFKNEKNRSGMGREEEEVPLDPKVQQEMDAIRRAHADARGPSLLDQHRAKVTEEKVKAAAATQDGKAEWKWNRDKDLDDGRRVDTNNLNMVMGGASKELNSKFQGSFS